MSVLNPEITASDIIADVNVRLDLPNLSATDYYPWISYAYQKTYGALVSAGQRIKEDLFGAYITFNLTNGTAEYSINTNIPRFGGFVKVEVKYGGTGDDWVTASRIESISNWRNQNNVSTSYRAKDGVVYYKLGDLLGFIPTPPATDSGTPSVRVWYVKKPYQITDGDDVIDIPYRFLYPIVNYVVARAIERENEDFSTAERIEAKFESELDRIIETAVSEIDERDGTGGIEVDAGSPLFDGGI